MLKFKSSRTAKWRPPDDSCQMTKPIVVKLGGSAITDKSKTCTPRLDTIHRAVGELAAYSDQLILLHGGGSYAHPFVNRKLLSSGFKAKSQLNRVSEVELNLDQLTRIIGVSLLLRGRPFVPLHPMGLMTLRNGKIARHFFQPLNQAIELGLIPILHGDLAMDDKKGVGVISADRIASLLGVKLMVARVLFGCDVDGVFSKPSERLIIPKVNRQNYASVLNDLKRSPVDVTGGMLGKVGEAITLARHGIESFIFNLSVPGNLTRLLKGDSTVGTRFVPWNQSSKTL